MTTGGFKRLARECGFELAGVAAAEPSPDHARYQDWIGHGLAGEMRYLVDHRARLRADPRSLLPSARSVLCVGKLYNTDQPYSTEAVAPDHGWISRYAWGADYHDVLRRDLDRLVALLPPQHDYRICVDTAPLLERSYARQAGLGWIGRNTCLINEPLGSWFFLGEILTSLAPEPDSPPPDRCGSCTRCIDACPTEAIRPEGYELDARRCISYFTIELRGPVAGEYRPGIGAHLFGCDICQDVCPWNRRAPVTTEPAFGAREFAPSLDGLAAMSEDDFRARFRPTPVWRTRYAGFLRNVAIAMGNSGEARFREPLERLAGAESELVREAARWALQKLAAA